MTPQTFGKYEVLEKVGEGGFGTVYKGRDPDLKRLVAIKTLSAPDPELRERFLREAEIAAGLQHARITTVHDFGTEGDRSYLVQEYLAGEDLDEVIARRERLPPERRLDWLIQVAEALHYAHGRDIVHRDVKPGNVRVTEEGGVKIMDFGIAKLLSAEDGLTRTGMTLGTAGYLPPEQLRGREVDRRADVFSFGVLAYELLSYRRPFEGGDISAVLYRIAHEEHPPLPEAWPGAPERLAAVIDRCLAKDPADRYPDLAPVIEEFRAARAELAGAGTGDQAATAVDPARLAPTVRVPSSGGAAPAHVPPADPPEDRRGDTYRTALRFPRRGAGWAALAAVLVAALALGLWALWPENGAGDGGPAGSDEGPTASAGAGDEAEPVQGADAAGVGSGSVTEEGAGADPAPASPEPEPAPPPAPPPVPQPSPPAPAPGGGPAPAPGGPSGGAPSPDSALPPGAPPRVLVAIAGEPASGARAAESALLEELLARGHEAVAPGGADLAGGDPGRIAAAGRRHGASRVVVGTFEGEAEPSVGRFYTGRAVLELRTYDAAGGRLLGAATVEVGGGGTRGEMAASELTALRQAATEAGRRAADEVPVEREGARP